MKILVACMACQISTGTPCGNSDFVTVTEPGVYEKYCPTSDRTTVHVLQCEKFEVFFEKSFLALSNESFSEAVILSVTALELFLGFVSKVVTYTSDTTFESMEKIDRLLSANAERNIGAYLLASELWATQNKTSLPFDISLIDEARSLRNKCAHKGYLPSPDQTKKHVESVAKASVECIHVMRNQHKEAFEKVVFKNHRKLFLKAKERQQQLGISDVSPATLGFPFGVGLTNAEPGFELATQVRNAAQNQKLFAQFART